MAINFYTPALFSYLVFLGKKNFRISYEGKEYATLDFVVTINKYAANGILDELALNGKILKTLGVSKREKERKIAKERCAQPTEVLKRSMHRNYRQALKRILRLNQLYKAYAIGENISPKSFMSYVNKEDSDDVIDACHAWAHAMSVNYFKYLG